MVQYLIPIGDENTAPVMYTCYSYDPDVAISNLIERSRGMFQPIEYDGSTIYYATDSVPGNNDSVLCPSFYFLYEQDGHYLTASIPARALLNGKRITLTVEDALAYLPLKYVNLS